MLTLNIRITLSVNYTINYFIFDNTAKFNTYSNLASHICHQQNITDSRYKIIYAQKQISSILNWMSINDNSRTTQSQSQA